MAPRDDQRFTFYGWSTCLWVLIISFQYGWHISVLNQIQAVLTCHTSSAVTATTVVPETYLGLPTCIPMSDAAFSSITSIFCAGGLLGSLAGDRAMNRWGRKGAAKASASMFALGAAIMGFAWSLSTLLIGRFVNSLDK
jgi:SP family facilitated glucose transporter-like MFS transporter 3